MPCHTVEYPEQSEVEKEIIKVLFMQDELIFGKTSYAFTHPKLGEQELTKINLDKLTNQLCASIRQTENIHGKSNTLQNWWMKHQIIDHMHLKEAYHKANDKDAYLASLSDYNKNVLKTSSLIKGLFQNTIDSVTYKLTELKEEKNKNRISLVQNIQFINILSMFHRLLNITHAESGFNKITINEIEIFFENTCNINLQESMSLKLYEHFIDAINRYKLSEYKLDSTYAISNLSHIFKSNGLALITSKYLKELMDVISLIKSKL